MAFFAARPTSMTNPICAYTSSDRPVQCSAMSANSTANATASSTLNGSTQLS